MADLRALLDTKRQGCFNHASACATWTSDDAGCDCGVWEQNRRAHAASRVLDDALPLLIDVVEAARDFYRLVVEAASDGSFNPMDHSDFDAFTDADLAMDDALAALDDHLRGDE